MTEATTLTTSTGISEGRLDALRMVGEYASRWASQPHDAEYREGLYHWLREARPTAAWGTDECDEQYQHCLQMVVDGFADAGLHNRTLDARIAISVALRGA